MEIVEEAPHVVEQIEERLFAAVNGRIKERMTTLKGWKGCYERCAGKEDDTSFAPADWPEDEDGHYLAYFTLYYVETGENYKWLSNAIGLGDAALCLQFMIEREFTNVNFKEYKKMFHKFYISTPALPKAGFLITRNGTIHRPFTLSAEKMAEEYPDFDATLAPLDAALDDLLTINGDFDKFVKELSRSDGLVQGFSGHGNEEN
jgi:hypothetical protein